MLLGYQKFAYSALAEALTIATADKKHRSVICIGSGWGVFERIGTVVTLKCLYGTINLKSFAIHGKNIKKCAVTLTGSKKILVDALEYQDNTMRIVFKQRVVIKAGKMVAITLG